MGDTNRLIERLKVPKIWDKENLVCPRKRCVLAVLLYRQPFKANKRYRTISDIAKSLGWNRRTVRDHLVQLKEWGYVTDQDGQYDVVRRANYAPLNSGDKAWWADYAWDWLNSDQYADCTEQYVLKVKSDHPDMGTTRLAALCGLSRRRIRDILNGGGALKKTAKKPAKEIKQSSVAEEPTAQELSIEVEEKQRHARNGIASTEKRLVERRITIDKMAVLRGLVSRYWVAAVCPERWDELCPGECRGVYPITPSTRQWYQENYGTVRQCA
jgi:predicted transcriptional regulator